MNKKIKTAIFLIASFVGNFVVFCMYCTMVNDWIWINHMGAVIVGSLSSAAFGIGVAYLLQTLVSLEKNKGNVIGSILSVLGSVLLLAGACWFYIGRESMFTFLLQICISFLLFGIVSFVYSFVKKQKGWRLILPGTLQIVLAVLAFWGSMELTRWALSRLFH